MAGVPSGVGHTVHTLLLDWDIGENQGVKVTRIVG